MGDCGVLRNGKIMLTGRCDDMVKINGVRVYLSEISSAIQNAFPSIKFVHPVSIESSETSLQLRAIVIFLMGDPSKGQIECSERELIEKIHQIVKIPPIRFLFVTIDECPLTPSAKKIDRQALRQRARALLEAKSSQLVPDYRIAASESLFGGLDDLSRVVLAALYASLETTLIISPNDSLKMLGFSSISAIQLCELLKEREVDLSLETLFNCNSVSDLIENLRNLPLKKGAQIFNEDNYEIEDFSLTKNLAAAIDMASESYAKANEYYSLIDLSLNQMKECFYQGPLLQYYELSKCSFTLHSRKSPTTILGIALSLDYDQIAHIVNGDFPNEDTHERHPAERLNDYMEHICEQMLTECIDSHKLQDDGVTPHRWLLANNLCVAYDIVHRSDGESAVLLGILERETIRRARTNGFTAIFSVNMSQATIVSKFCTTCTIYSYTVLYSLQYYILFNCIFNTVRVQYNKIKHKFTLYTRTFFVCICLK